MVSTQDDNMTVGVSLMDFIYWERMNEEAVLGSWNNKNVAVPI
jgi:hypothetical protein